MHRRFHRDHLQAAVKHARERVQTVRQPAHIVHHGCCVDGMDANEVRRDLPELDLIEVGGVAHEGRVPRRDVWRGFLGF
jgi:hypothetical protein